MRPETPAALAEISARFGNHEIRHHHRLCFGRDIGKEHELARLLTFIENLLVHGHHEVPDLAVLVFDKFRDRHLRNRKNRVGAIKRQHVEPTDYRIAQVLRRRFLWAVEKLFAINDLQNAALVGAVAEIDPVALRAGRNRPCNSVGTVPVEPGSCPTRPKSRIWTGFDGSLRSKTWVMRRTRQPSTPDT